MLARIFSTLLLWTLTAVVLIYTGDYGWLVLVATLASGALWELCAILKKAGLEPMTGILQLCNAAIFLSSPFLCKFDICSPTMCGSMVFAVCAAFIAAFTLKDPFSDYPKRTVIPSILSLTAISFTFQWLTVFCQYPPMNSPTFDIAGYKGMAVGVLILATAKFSDIGAYVIGRAFGRHKLSPSISPNKTIEGAIGGIFSSGCAAAGLLWGLSDFFNPGTNIPVSVFVGFAIGIVSMVSDLLESVLKRRTRVKDSGTMIPGIGGTLDLADSIVLTAPVGVFLFSLTFIL